MKNRKETVYTIATAHLDTSWLWLLEQTIDDYLPDTVKRNLAFMKKYPAYKFNFEGSYRYELIKEYHPALYEKMKEAIRTGQWNVCGSCYENGDVNIPSPEALIRNILYGNSFFEKEFGVKSNDIFLPDCFGFGKALPSVAAHCGLNGFSTGKLFWGSSVPIPFDTGRWVGADGKGIFAALMPFSYTTAFKDVRQNKRILEKMADNKKKNMPGFTLAYHGNGDRGGAPHKGSVKSVIKAQNENATHDTQILSASTNEFFDMLDALPEAEKQKLPVYDGEFLLTAHGAGSYTSRTVTKRWNKRCELLADAAERFCATAFVNALAAYPQYKLDTAWKQVIAHHFHDDITGTSFEECYKRNHNDYVQALNTFSVELTAACHALVDAMDTSFVKGTAVAVANPLQGATDRLCTAKVHLTDADAYHTVYDKDGNILPSQTKRLSDTECEVIFTAAVPSCGIAVFDIREAQEAFTTDTQLHITQNSIENKYLRVQLNDNGEIESICDKVLGKELLSGPIQHTLLPDVHSFDWPAWEIRYEDICAKPFTQVQKQSVTIEECGPALCTLKIVSKAGNSVFTQLVSLGSESRFVSVYNETDWREEAALLKATFSLTAKNEKADYDTGIGCVSRGTNTKTLYEVPAQKWAGIRDTDNDFGVSVFSDARTGWDKPDANTLRLTCVHTPLANYRWECSQHIMDMGLNRYSYAVMGHNGNDNAVSAYADAFCMPVYSFVTDAHKGTLEPAYSFFRLNNENVRVLALKKALDSDNIILRVAECTGKPVANVQASFSAPVRKAAEVRGDEVLLQEMNAENGNLCFDLQKNEIRSFALAFDKKEIICNDAPIALPCNAVGITDDNNRALSTLPQSVSIPRELLPEKLLSGGVTYHFETTNKNCLRCDGSVLHIGSGYDSVCLLLTSLDGDKQVTFTVGDQKHTVLIPDAHEALGHWDLLQQGLTGYIKPVPQAFTLSHTHHKNGNLTAKQFYLFAAEIPLAGQEEIRLPDDKQIVLFAATAIRSSTVFLKGSDHSDTLTKRTFDYTFSDYATKHMLPNKAERFLNRIVDRTRTFNIKAGEFCNKYAVNEIYFILRHTKDKLFYNKAVQHITDQRKQ